jgi:HEAT repeat protein
LTQDLRVDAIVAFVQMQHPTTEATRVPLKLITDSNPAVRSAARMMSGALARAARPEHAEEADSIDASLIALYRGARDMREKSDLLAALGNSVGPDAVPVIEEALGDASVSVRAAAVRALRLAGGIKIDRLLAAAITSDHDAAVRSHAIVAARFRHPLPAPLADALIQAASSDAVGYVRSDALAVLRQNPTSSVRIPETLDRIAKLDADPGIRRQAREALADLSPTTSHP